MKHSPLETILDPQSIVIVGASPDPRKMGTIMAVNLLAGGYRGEVSFLHRTAKSVLGRPAYPSAAELPEVVDLAVLVTPTGVTPRILDELGARGVRRAVVITAGFKEVGGDGAARAVEVRDAARRHGVRFVGPNCIGVLNTHASLNLTVAPYLAEPGPLGLTSQSGTLVAQTHFLFRQRGIRLSKAISVGNATDIGIIDCLEFLARDPETRAIALYVEGIQDGPRFVEVAREITTRKPIVALYVGGTEAGARAGRSHTASLGGHDRIYDGLFEQAGVARARTVDELFSWGWALASMPRPRGRRVAILTHSGGPAASMADECDRLDLDVPVLSEALQQRLRAHVPPTGSTQNPVDLTFTLDPDGFAKRLPEALFASDEVDAVLIHGLMDTGFVKAVVANMALFYPVDPVERVEQSKLDTSFLTALPHRYSKPLVGSTFVWDDHATSKLLEAGVPISSSPQEAVRVLRALVYAAEVAARPPHRPERLDVVELPELDAVAGAEDLILDEHASKQVLARLGAPVPAEVRCARCEDALEAADRIGFPVVLKGLVSGVAHKSDVGLVHLDIRSPDAVTDAWARIAAIAPGCACLVAPMLRGERELAVGLLRVPGLGAAVMLGQGGVFAEAIGDVTFRLAPVSRTEAAVMVDSLRGRAIYGPIRGLPEVDREALADVILSVSRLAILRPEVVEVDLNPVIVTGGRPYVADALIRVVSE